MTPIQRQNLAKLALHVRALPKSYSHFRMQSYASNGGEDGDRHPARKIDVNVCGTAACLAGHGPLAGIKPGKGETWDTYGSRVFCNSWAGEQELFLWLFCANWDDSKSNACKRVAWLLQGKRIPSITLSCSGHYPDDFGKFRPNWKLVEAIANGSELSVNP